MRISWREFLRQRFRKASSYDFVGIELGETSLHISSFRGAGSELTWVKHHVIPNAGWAAHLEDYVAQHRLGNTPCRVALSIAKYQILQMDKPGVVEPEVLQALQWSVRDQIPGEEELVLDYFDYPASLPTAPKLNVVAIAKSEIMDICRGIRQAGLKLDSIGIEELATCELLPASDDAVMTLFQEKGAQICLNIVKQGKLFFSRRLRGYENLSSFSSEAQQTEAADTLTLDIQRSMDYFESQLRQAPVKTILISLDSPYQEALAALIAQLTLSSVEVFKPAINLAQGMEFSAASFASIGVVMGRDGHGSQAGP